jgi:hypothetical protein
MSFRRIVGLVCAAIVGALAATVVGARAQLLTPTADKVRFEMVTNEPVAAPDNRSVVAGWSAAVIRDRKSGQCFVAVTEGDSMSLAPAQCR